MITLHLILVVLTGLAVLYSDEQALAWFLGKKELLHPKAIQVSHLIVTFGLAGIIITGAILFSQADSYYLHSATFILKMLFVFALVINGGFIDRFSHIPISRSFVQIEPHERAMLLVSGGISLLGWMGAAVCGLVLGGIL